MRKLFYTSLLAAVIAIPAFSGALTLQIDNTNLTPEAIAQHAIVVAHITACRSPEKTTVTATAEGIANGKRQSVPLNVIKLSEPGAFAVSREFPLEGAWTVKMIATNPDYKNYATAIVVPIGKDGPSRESTKVFYHAPLPGEVDAILQQNKLE